MEESRPIIVKRPRKGRSGSHGGSWKVAFADFATAMMAFFLVLWLLSTASPEQRLAIQGYFRDPVGFTEGGTASPIDLGGSPRISPTTQSSTSAGAQNMAEEEIALMAEMIEQQRLESLMEVLRERIEETPSLNEFKEHLVLDITDEGLRIQIVDRSQRPMFDSGSARLKAYSEEILFELAKVIGSVPNRLSISGHTDALPFGASDRFYSNWELSADRANAARRALIQGGLSQERIARVVGLSSTVLFDEQDPYNPVNRRISIIVLNKRTEQKLLEREAQKPESAQVAPKLPSKAEQSIQRIQLIDPKEVRW